MCLLLDVSEPFHQGTVSWFWDSTVWVVCAFGPLGIPIPPTFLDTISYFNIVIFLSVSPEAVSVKGCPLLLSFL